MRDLPKEANQALERVNPEAGAGPKVGQLAVKVEDDMPPGLRVVLGKESLNPTEEEGVVLKKSCRVLWL
jgi:hypothetical protein